MFFVELFKAALKRIKSLSKVTNRSSRSSEDRIRRRLVHKEAMLGGQLFGPIPEGKRRDFFCYDENTWVWHESVTNDDGSQHIVTTRYEIYPEGIVKIQDGRPHERANHKEAKRLLKAASRYQELVNKRIYQRV